MVLEQKNLETPGLDDELKELGRQPLRFEYDDEKWEDIEYLK